MSFIFGASNNLTPINFNWLQAVPGSAAEAIRKTGRAKPSAGI
jgi:hypothetical protein